MAAICSPSSGETYWWILPKVNINLFQSGIGRLCQTILAPSREQANHFGDGSSRLAYKFAVEVPEGDHFGVHAFPFTRTSTSRASVASTINGRESVIQTLDDLEGVLFSAVPEAARLIRVLGNCWWRGAWAINQFDIASPHRNL